MWGGINRRKFPRVRYRCTIIIKQRDSSQEFPTYTENVGAGGICVNMEKGLGLFQGVGLEIFLGGPHATAIKCAATVVWVVKKHTIGQKGAPQYDTGLEFVDMDEEGKKCISEIVEMRLKNGA
ncbi:MAG: PilZ domain-containing protein [Omnitrophica bacterium]|nr:PilZ domain-containing protein [Candidatus Omnitrophota bacterium]